MKTKKTKTTVRKTDCVAFDAAYYRSMYELGSLHEVGAALMAVLAYAYGTHREFCQAMADCSEATREYVLRICLDIWRRRHPEARLR